MNPGLLSYRVVADRLGWLDTMLTEIERLPLESYDAFTAENRNVWAAESCLRRALEALLDLGRHIAAKGFGLGVSEYEEIAQRLHELGILDENNAQIMRKMAGYRNRLVHFYHEVSTQELYDVCSKHLDEVRQCGQSMKQWIKMHPEMIDTTL